ncbi:IS3 family transposase, partial [Streptomyces hirsutus]|uniref:IS3 family transposase n=1 Tax=Streptomyces hirsutus TaxID=35620 RepID=UPI00200D325C
MVMKNYPPQFKADAVALYQSRPEATIRQVAADLGINPETLRNWVRAAGASRPRGRRAEAPAEPPTPLEAENAALRKKVRELEEEREILRKAAKYFGRGDALVNRFQFVADHQRRYGVKRLCTILGIARSSFYYWRATAADRAARQAADARLATRIRAVHHESDGTYGVPRITAELREAGERVNHKRIARVMRSINLAGVRLRRRHRTTTADPAAAKAPDLIGRDFTASEPNTKYVGDITYLPLDGGKFLYLATVIDLASRRLAGWAIADHMRTELVSDALAAAERTRGGLAGAVLHTDHGAQYTSFRLAEHLDAAGIAASIGSVGDAYDNALMESAIGLFKTELIKPQRPWKTLSQVELATAEWIDWYNHRRLHGEIGHVPPVEYEANDVFSAV